jgi:V/A-type H+-transporting ATPase subunit D
MAKLGVPPTKSSLLRVKRDYAFAQEGAELLEQKRQILALELMARLEHVRAVRREVDERLASAHQVLRTTLASVGVAQMARESLGIADTHKIGVKTQRVMGINLPKVELTVNPVGPEFAPGQGAVQADDVMKRFREALEAIARLAEIENAVVRLSRELKKTQRRVNALNKVVLPDYRETLKYIMDVLEERERDGFVIMKMTKARLEKERESATENQ